MRAPEDMRNWLRAPIAHAYTQREADEAEFGVHTWGSTERVFRMPRAEVFAAAVYLARVYLSEREKAR